MLARLHSQRIPSKPNEAPPLANLSTRAGDDPSLALLDAMAVAADVLTFYQERIANEGYLRTATERRSVLEMARSIGYELKPGVAAGTYLSFTVEDADGAPRMVTVSKGTQVQSIPPQGKLPHTFETTEELEARGDWNVLKPQLKEKQKFEVGTTKLYLKGTSSQIQPGDSILLVGADRETRPGSEQWDIRIVKTVTTFPDKNYTLITWEDGLGHETPDTSPAANPKAFVFRQRASLFGYNAPDWKALSATVKRGYDDTIDVDKSATWYRRNEWPNFEIRTINPPRIDLDADYPKILEGSWVALVKPTYVELYRAQVVTSHSRTDFTLTAKSTRIETDTDEHLSWFGLRETVALAQSEKLVRADRPITTPVFGNEVVLDELVDGFDEDDLDLVKKPLIVSGKLARYARVADLSHTIRTGTAEVPGQVPQLKLQPTDGTADVTLKVGDVLEVAGLPSTLTDGSIKWHFKTSDGVEGHLTLDADSEALEWQPADKDENAISEALFIKDISNSAERTTVTLSAALKNLYDRSTTKIHANVVATTHGETTKGEVPGKRRWLTSQSTLQAQEISSDLHFGVNSKRD